VTGEGGLTTFQVEVAHLFFQLNASEGYVMAGGAALVALKLIRRLTQDLDLFTSAPVVSVTAAKESFLKALSRSRWTVTVIHDNPTFCRLVVTDRGDEVLVDLAVDSPPRLPPTVTVLGPTLAPLELAGRKLLALFDRAEARDFADVYVLADRFGKDALLIEASAADPGFDEQVLAQMMTTLDRFSDDDIPTSAEVVPEMRLFFARWAEELSRD
jgi:Nucleotidyl transferase AbiEii toxin, Type IV TA system